MGSIIAIANQKGGVGKTTSAVSLAAELALKGERVLLVDLDPQGNATSGLGVEFHEEGQDTFDMFFGSLPAQKLICRTEIENLDLIPSSRDLVGLEIELGKKAGRELILQSELSGVKNRYDLIFVDCPPSSGLLSLNALGAAQHLVVPIQAEYYALEGLSALMDTIRFVQQTFNPGLSLLGVFLTMYDSRTNLSSQVKDEVGSYFGEALFESVIPRNIRISEAPSHGLPISLYSPESAGRKAYLALAEELLARLDQGAGDGKVVANL